MLADIRNELCPVDRIISLSHYYLSENNDGLGASGKEFESNYPSNYIEYDVT
jgi:hypothetical protein